MLYLLAQNPAGLDPSVLVNGGFSALAIYLVYHVTAKQEKANEEHRKGLSEIRDALMHLTHSNLIQLMAHPSLEGSVKQVAEKALKEVEAAQAEYQR
jgi:hypothetical protein